MITASEIEFTIMEKKKKIVRPHVYHLNISLCEQ
jgi:hypothetical protein